MNTKRLLLVSNRLPITVTKRKNKLNFHASPGGLATGLYSIFKSLNGVWVGWPGVSLATISPNEKRIVEDKLIADNLYPVFLQQKEIEHFYSGFCNRTIWPLFHYFTQYTVYDKCYWRYYKRVNELYAKSVLKVAKPNDIIWVQDFHLMLVPYLLRKEMPDATIGFFLHIPFPSYEVFRLLPWRKELLEGMLGSNLIGFHTFDYAVHFLESTRRIVGRENTFGQIIMNNRIVKVDVFPMGIDYEKYATAQEIPMVKKEIERLKKKVDGMKVILSVDRLDYTKGIVERLKAFDVFLSRNKDQIEKILLILVAVPSRKGVIEYKNLKKKIDELVGEINGKYSTIGWMPIWYMYRSLPFSRLAALYSISDIALVTPIRDGMNLIAKEFVASRKNGRGVLILSEMAGAVKELGEAIIVNPNNFEESAFALEKALKMPHKEEIERNRRMQRRLRIYNILAWGNDFINRLNQTKIIQSKMDVKKVKYEIKMRLIDDFKKSQKRLFILDYDGTLVPFFTKPQDAKPDKKILILLDKLTSDEKNEVVIISGRDKNTLEKWFGHLPIGLVGEHGVWIRETGKKAKKIRPMKNEWKKEIWPILEMYSNRTPGSFVEEKDYSLVWHYRNVEPQLAEIRAMELKDNLLNLTANLDLDVLEGSKVIEIKNSGVNKGKAIQQWLFKEKWDFILAIGDDWTDENMFEALPEWAYTIKVGWGISKAKFYLNTNREVRELLEEIVKYNE